jgi:LysR substrate binding domain
MRSVGGLGCYQSAYPVPRKTGAESGSCTRLRKFEGTPSDSSAIAAEGVCCTAANCASSVVNLSDQWTNSESFPRQLRGPTQVNQSPPWRSHTAALPGSLHRHLNASRRLHEVNARLRSRGRNVTLMPASRLRVDDGDAIVRAAALGMGIGQVPHYMVTDLLARAELVELLPAMRPAPMPIAALTPSARLIPALVRVLLDLLERSADAFPGAPPVNANTSHRRRPRD